jgi:hypothetical protein
MSEMGSLCERINAQPPVHTPLFGISHNACS